MKPHDDDLDPLIDSLLRETLGNEPAPDLRAAILARVPDRKLPSLRRFRHPQGAGGSWMAAAVAACIFAGIIVAAALRSGPEKPAAPSAGARKSVEKVPAPAEALPPREPDPAPAPPRAPEPRRPEPPKPLPSTPAEKERPPEPPRKEEPRNVEPPPPVPAPPKGERETRVSGIALIQQMEGDAQVLDGETRLAAVTGQEIFPKQGLATSGPKSRVVLKYPDGTLLELGSDSLVRELSEGAGRGKTLLLARGLLTADVKKQPLDRPMIVTTPHGEAKVLGTTLRLRVDPADKGATRLDVMEGKVRLTRFPDLKAADVVTGHYAVAAVGVEPVSRMIAPPRTGTADRPVVVKFQVLSAETGLPILQLDPIEDRMVIALSDLPTRNLNIRAVTSPESIGCVVFTLDGEVKIEVRSPFLLMGNNPVGKPLPWTPAAGDHVLTATPYSGGPAANRREGTGNAGAPITVRFRVR